MAILARRMTLASEEFVRGWQLIVRATDRTGRAATLDRNVKRVSVRAGPASAAPGLKVTSVCPRLAARPLERARAVYVNQQDLRSVSFPGATGRPVTTETHARRMTLAWAASVRGFLLTARAADRTDKHAIPGRNARRENVRAARALRARRLKVTSACRRPGARLSASVKAVYASRQVLPNVSFRAVRARPAMTGIPVQPASFASRGSANHLIGIAPARLALGNRVNRLSASATMEFAAAVSA